MKFLFYSVIFAFLLAMPVLANEWLDEFDENDLDEAWCKITWRPGDAGSATLDDGKLLINEPGDFGHMVIDGRPLMLRKTPEGDFSISVLIDTDPPAPAVDYWVGLFIIAEDGDHPTLADNLATLSFGGSSGEKKALIGSMIDGAWDDKGHFDIPEWPVYLKLEKTGDQYTGYFKEKPTDEWAKIGATWTHAGMAEPELLGLGFLNNWGGAPDLTVIVDYFLLEGEHVIPRVVQSTGKLPSAWGYLKTP